VHHYGADRAHAVGAISRKPLFAQRFALWHGCCNAVAVRYRFAKSGVVRAMKTNKTIGIGL
jgi:hypothetical protein